MLVGTFTRMYTGRLLVVFELSHHTSRVVAGSCFPVAHLSRHAADRIIDLLIVAKTAKNSSGRNDILSYNCAMTKRKRHQVAAAIYDGLLGFEYAIAAELMGLVRPGLEKTWYDFKPCRVESGELKSSHGFILKPAGGRSDLVPADTVLIAGCAILNSFPSRRS